MTRRFSGTRAFCGVERLSIGLVARRALKLNIFLSSPHRRTHLILKDKKRRNLEVTSLLMRNLNEGLILTPNI